MTRTYFTGGGPDAPGYPWPKEHPNYGLHANPGFYDELGNYHVSDVDPKQVFDPGDPGYENKTPAVTEDA